MRTESREKLWESMRCSLMREWIARLLIALALRIRPEPKDIRRRFIAPRAPINRFDRRDIFDQPQLDIELEGLVKIFWSWNNMSWMYRWDYSLCSQPWHHMNEHFWNIMINRSTEIELRPAECGWSREIWNKWENFEFIDLRDQKHFIRGIIIE